MPLKGKFVIQKLVKLYENKKTVSLLDMNSRDRVKFH